MSHPKDIDEQRNPQRDDAHQGAEDEARLMLLDMLYGELDEAAQERAERRVREDEDLAGELEGWGRVRELMRELPEEEPPEALSAALLHAAAAEAGVEGPSAAPSEHATEDGAAVRAVAAHGPGDADGDERRSLWARLKDLFMPVMMHPGLAAAASLVLVAGVAGALYVSGRSPAVDMRAPSAASAPDVGSSQSELAKKEGAALDSPTATLAGAAAGEAEPAAEDAEADLNSEVAADLADDVADKDEVVLRGGRQGLARGVESKSAANERVLPEAAEGVSGGMVRTRETRSTAKRSKAKLDSYDKGGLAEKRADRKQKSEGPGGVFGGGFGGGGYGSGSAGGAIVDEAQNQAPSGSSSGSSSGVVGGDFAAPPPPPAAKKPRPARKARSSASPSTPTPAPAAPAEAPAIEEEEAPSREAEASAPRQEPSAPRDDRAGASDDDASDGASETRARAERLYRRARTAASKDDCVTVTKLATQVRNLDPVFYTQVFLRNKTLSACLAAKNATKK